MVRVIDGTRIAPHGLFFMESTGAREIELNVPSADDERGQGCFALEEERGEGWHGTGATTVLIKDVRPTL